MKGVHIMKKAILITGIITIVGYAITALIMFIVASVATDPQVINEVMNTTGATREQAEAAARITQAGFIVTGVIFLIGVAFAIVLIALRNNTRIKKGAGIALGVLGIVFSTLPGIFFLVDSVKNR